MAATALLAKTDDLRAELERLTDLDSPAAETLTKRIEKRLASYEESIKQAVHRRAELQDHHEFFFDQSGIDYLCLDEAHEFKNAEVVSTARNLSGVPVGLRWPTTTGLQIDADGAWRVDIKPVDAARRFGAEANGQGDDVLIYEGDAQVVALSHQGDANFAVWFHGDIPELLVNEIGVYNATVPIRDGPAVVEINANGPWSITPA